MNDTQREALILEFVRKLKSQGSWCGETHIQKSIYFLQELMGVPLSLNYIFYKHGPFSFELSDQLTALRGNGLVELRSHPPYGPHLHASESSGAYLSRFNTTIGSFQPATEFVAEKLAKKNVSELERLSTALYVRLQMPELDDNALALEMNRLKPHVTVQEAMQALSEVRQFDADRKALLQK